MKTKIISITDGYINNYAWAQKTNSVPTSYSPIMIAPLSSDIFYLPFYPFAMETKEKLPIIETQRLNALYSYNIINPEQEEFLDHITNLASNICEAPIALISLVDKDRQIFKSRVGIKLTGTSRDFSFCHYAIQQDSIYEVQDATKDKLFANNPLVTGELNLRSYAGVPLKEPSGFKLGALCVFDHKPRKLTALQVLSLNVLATAAIDYIVLKKNKKSLASINDELNQFFELSPDLLCIASMEGYFKKISSSFITQLGYTEKELLEKPFIDFVHPDDKQKTIDIVKDLSVDSKKVTFFKNRYLCKNGNYIWLSWNAIPDPKTNQIIATARNITEVRRLGEELEKKKTLEAQVNQAKIRQLSSLTTSLSNEILNPLNLVIGFADLTLDLLKDLPGQDTLESKEETLDQIRADQLKIIEHSRYILNIMLKMTHDASFDNIPSVLSRYDGHNF